MISNIDIAIIVLYFIGMLGIGVYVNKRAKRGDELESYLAADRDVGLLRTAATSAATDLGGGFTIALAGLGFTLGISASWLMLCSALSAVFAAFLTVPVIKRWADRCKGYTTGELFGRRFDEKTRLIAGLLLGLSWWAFVGGQIIAGGKLAAAIMGIDLTTAIIVIGAIVLAYTVLGGLKAVILTDVVQMVILFVGIILFPVPLGWFKVGGWENIVATLSQSPETANLTSWSAVDLKTAVGWFLSIFPVWFISMATHQRIIAAKDANSAKWGIFLTGIPIEWPLFALGGALVGLYARVLLQNVPDPEMAMPYMIANLLPVGISGLVLAAYIAAVMSTADSCLMVPVSTFVNDFYRKLKPNASPSELVKVGQISALVLGLLAIALAYKVPSIIDLILYAYTFAASGLFFPMLGLLFWKRATATGAFASILLGGLVGVGWSIAGNPYGLAASYPGWIVSFVTLVVVSLMTQHSPEEDLDTFYS